MGILGYFHSFLIRNKQNEMIFEFSFILNIWFKLEFVMYILQVIL